MFIESICPYCGCSCKLSYEVNKGKIIGVKPVKDDICSNGMPCIKGLTSWEPAHTERIKNPLKNKDGTFVRITWQEAYNLIKDGFSGLKKNEIYFTGSANYTLESNYLMQKMAREVFKTNNVDNCARLCHAATGVGFKKLFGIGRVPNKMDDVLESDLIFAIGTNPMVDYPVFYNRIIQTRKNAIVIQNLFFRIYLIIFFILR